MERYILLLRGINVGGHKKVPMVDLKDLLMLHGLAKVQTYIQSGNVVFESADTPQNLENLVSKLILERFGFEVKLVVFAQAYLQQVADNNPFKDKEDAYFSFLTENPVLDNVRKLDTISSDTDFYAMGDKVVYLYCSQGYRNTRFDNNTLERMLKVGATTRNMNTVNKLLILVKNI